MDKIFNCLLVGETGSGKSSFGNLAVGISDAFEVSEDAESCTKDTFRKISQLDPEISIVDTPGLQDSTGSDKVHYEKMLQIIKHMKYLHFILIVFNYTCPRFTSSIQFMIKFLCNVFPKNFAHHVGIIFTHYHHDYQVKINKKKNDPREKRESLIRNVMELISKTTNEELFLGPPVYFLDSYIEDDNSKAELNRLLAFAKTLNPIEDIRENCNLKHKKEEEEFDTRTEEIIEGDYIVTYTKKYSRKKYTDYNDNITYDDWILINTDKKYRSAPVRTEYQYVYVDREEKSKEDDKKIQEEQNNKEEEKRKKRDVCDKVAFGGQMGAVGGILVTAAGALLTPFCPVVGPGLIYAGLAGAGVSEAASMGGIIADEVIKNQ